MSRTDPIFVRLPGGGYAYSLVDQDVRVELRYLRRERGQQHAEVDVQCGWPGARQGDGSLSCADLNLSSQPARKSLAQYCAARARTQPDEFDWFGAIDTACLRTIRAERESDAVIVLDDAIEVTDQDINVHGLYVPMDATSLLIAHGDSLKSLVLLLVLGTLARQGRPVLYLDWEWTAPRHKARKQRLLGPDRLDGLHYLRCRAPLVVELDRIRRFCDAQQIEFMGVDSVGLACDGKLIDDDVARRFHQGLAMLPPSLCAAHVPKGSLSPDSKTEPSAFGSVFFSNLCRASWNVRKHTGADDDVVTVGFFPGKQNDGPRRRPVALEFTFNTDEIRVKPINCADVDGFVDKLPLWQRMAAELRNGPQTIAAVADTLHAKPDTIDRLVRRFDKTFVRLRGQNSGEVSRIALVTKGVA